MLRAALLPHQRPGKVAEAHAALLPHLRPGKVAETHAALLPPLRPGKAAEAHPALLPHLRPEPPHLKPGKVAEARPLSAQAAICPSRTSTVPSVSGVPPPATARPSARAST